MSNKKYRELRLNGQLLSRGMIMTRESLRPVHCVIVRLLIIGVLVAAGGGAAEAEVESGIAITAKVIRYDTELLAGEVKIPVIAGVGDVQLERQLNDRWQREIMSFVEEIREGAETAQEELGEETRHWLPFQVYVDFHVAYLDERFVSLPIAYYCYTGGAHGMSSQVSTNIDLAAGRDLNLEDLFVPGYDFTTVIASEVRRQRAANADHYFDESVAETDILPDHHFYLTSEGIVVYFDLYEIAPYSTGIPEFTIPYERLRQGLKPEFQALTKAE